VTVVKVYDRGGCSCRNCAHFHLFGSAARGKYDKVNHLDLLIIKDDVPVHGLDRMRELDDLVERNIAADMLVYRSDEFDQRTKLGDPFIEMILKEGRVLYG
jgi:predicted nucleotidyltransferase